jgi:hypothetical protein
MRGRSAPAGPGERPPLRARPRSGRRQVGPIVAGLVATAALGALLLAVPLRDGPPARRSAAEGEPTVGVVQTIVGTPALGVTALADLGFGPTRARGTRVAQEFFFPGSGDLLLADPGATLTIELAHSNLLDPARSAVSVLVNDRPLRALPLTSASVDGLRLPVEVPRDLLLPDFNKVTLEFAMALGVNCEDPTHPGLFATVLPASSLELRFADEPARFALAESSLAEYPYPFARAGYPAVAPITVVLPTDPSAAELTAGYRVAIDLASRVFFEVERLEIVHASELATIELATRQLILVGTPDRHRLVADVLASGVLAAAALDGSGVALNEGALVEGGRRLGEEEGLLALGASPWNPALRALLLTGAGDAAVRNAVDALTRAEPTALLAGPVAAVGASAGAALPGAGASESGREADAFRFGDVGVGDLTVRGEQVQTIDLSLRAPSAAGEAGALDLVLSWPETVDGRRSNVIVSLNGQLVETLELRGSERQHTPMRIALPAELLRPGPNALRLETRLYAVDERDADPVCDSRADERLWLTVHSDSAVSFPGDGDAGARALDLAALPYPFAGRAGLRETALVVDPASPASLRAGLLTAIALGRLGEAKGRATDIEVLPQAEATPERLGTRHVVAAGLAPGGPLDGALADALPLLLAPDGTRRLLAGAETLAELLTPSRLGAVQVAPAPWAPERRLLVLQGTDDVALGWAARALLDRRLAGTVALLSGPKAIETLVLARDVAPPPAPVAEQFTESESRARQLVALALIAAGAGALLVAWAFRDRIARMI